MSAVCMVRVSSLMALLSPGGAISSGKKLLTLAVYNVFHRLSGGPGVFLPEVLPGKGDRGAPFQDTVIDAGVDQVRRFRIVGKFVISTGTSRSSRALAIQPTKKNLPVPTSPNSSRPLSLAKVSSYR